MNLRQTILQRFPSIVLIFVLTFSGTISFSGMTEGGEFSRTACAPYIDQCGYYACRESIQSCGPEGYWLRFGYNYCDRFMTETRPKLSPEGQRWMDQVGQCLRDRAETFPLELSCKAIETEAIASHSPCYLETGFCQIHFWEKMEILRVVFRELSDSRFRNVLMQILRGCSQHSRL